MSLLDRELTQLAYCWIAERRDGAGIALTSHDRSLLVDAAVYAPMPGISPRSLRLASGLEPDDNEVAGMIADSALTASDLASGLWDGARVRLFIVDWSDPEGERIDLFEGEFGEIRAADGAFEAALKGPAAALDAPASPETSPLCRARLGDERCRVDLAGRCMRSTVVEQVGAQVRIGHEAGEPYRFGALRVLDGACRNLSTAILAIAGDTLTLRDLPPEALAPGTRLLLEEGCDKRFATCCDRFANAPNFRGEPHLPGSDILTRYPGG